ncbi:MAG TPA: radical SAM protein [Deltaproteobacteria bacterium]|nr:radical SAM protein [Deltaproteobacteria bacterium]
MKITTINSIETSSICDRKCQYCPCKDQGKHREVGLMTMEVFEKAMEWILYFSRQGTQQELNLFGVGEPTLNPLLPEMIELAKKNIRIGQPVHINTNGQWIDTSTTKITEKELAYVSRLKRAGISHIDLTGHNAFRTAKAIRVLQSVNISGQLSIDYITNPNTWAGQVEWFPPQYNAGPCPWLLRGQVMIMSNGDVTRCCIDAFGTGVMGNVMTDDLSKMNCTSFALCESCHHDIGQAEQRRIIL